MKGLIPAIGVALCLWTATAVAQVISSVAPNIVPGFLQINGTGIRFGGSAAANPYFRVSGANMDLVAGDGSIYRQLHLGQAQLNSGTIISDTINGGIIIQSSAGGHPAVSGLPTCNAANKGGQAMVTDATVAASGNFGAAVVGSGANSDPVYCDGTSWKIG